MAFLYARPSDNVIANATIAASTEETGYGVANLYDGNPAKPWKATSTTGFVTFDFGSAQNIDIVAIVHHNLTAGLEVRIQADDASDFSSLDLNQTITIPAYDLDDFPINPWIDLSALSNSWRYWRLNVVGTNSANVAIGELWLVATKRTLPSNQVRYGVQEVDTRPVIEHVTDYGVVTIYDQGVRLRAVVGEMFSTNSGLDDMRAWWRDCHGRALPTLIITDENENDALLVRWREISRVDERASQNYNTLNVAWDEVSRGLVL